MSREELLAKLTGEHPTYIRRRALPDQVAAVNAIGEIAFEFSREKERLYPQLTLAAHVLGFTNAEGTGVTGVEGAFEDRLTNAAPRGQPPAPTSAHRVKGVPEHHMGKEGTHNEEHG